ncbi:MULTISPECIES: hypothetical protein [Rhodopseudomonas]|uniref:Uncharacterized protein n=1 Tax=Rhodopseudomonas palustris TaxID=1076 RepID=A0A0D7F5B3_RHOPL|nr:MULTISPECIES: hypothetical protein [Rhodopseudomonas]KIZ47975.1 hypothetical protein OO17_01390 [Rhodopseudomonas palustris]MDF3808775.1 hypothetical protein [Rhodopseudomonas sp. BAL398]WOK19188.1 hypothetical protein RBJ75_06635 [Rhodopseudomonas sp. BAL398]
MKAAVERVIQTYGLLTSREAAELAQPSVESYIRMLFEAGETDDNRLTVCGLVFLREHDGSNDPVKAGFTGM